jgi:hypothetical protein
MQVNQYSPKRNPRETKKTRRASQSRQPDVASILVPDGFTIHYKSFVVQILFTSQPIQKESVNAP